MEGSPGGVVLIVEDDWLCAVSLRDKLEGLGFTNIRCAHNLSAGEFILATSPPRLAILDVRLGDEEVFPLAQRLREQGVPIVFASACSRADLPEEWANYPLAMKPVDIASLTAAIETQLGAGALRRGRRYDGATFQESAPGFWDRALAYSG
jgi:DNA-binding response OmpR family regulator